VPGSTGEPDFRALLHGRTQDASVYCFDLMELQGHEIREQPLVQRRAQLEALLKRAGSRLVRFREGFPDAGVLFIRNSNKFPGGLGRQGSPGSLHGRSQPWSTTPNKRETLRQRGRLVRFGCGQSVESESYRRV
jgi:bifunctional non-homologous end joining protein LigD